MIKLYGNPGSTCTRKVLMTLEESKTPYELSNLDFMKGEHKADAHVARQPFGQMPALDDDGFAMYESRAMMRYIAEKASSPLEPKDVKARATMEQWISIETSNFTPHAMKFVYHHFMGRKQDEQAMEAATAGLDKACDVLEARLATSPYLAGTDMTLADVAYMPYIEYAMNTPAKAVFEKHPALMAWWKRLSERPTWRKVIGKA